MKAKLATAPTIQRIEQIINQYFYSTTYKVNPDNLELTSSKGVNLNYFVEFKKGRYIFNQR